MLTRYDMLSIKSLSSRLIHRTAAPLSRWFRSIKLPRRNVFYTFLFSYAMILIISLIIGSIIFRNVRNVVENEVKEANLALLEQGRDIIDERMGEVDRIIVQLSMNDKINNLLRLPSSFSGDEYYKLWEINNQLLPYSISNDFMKYMFLYFKNANIIISPTLGSFRLDTFYDLYIGNRDEYGNWSRIIQEDTIIKQVLPSNAMKFTVDQQRMLTYLAPLGNDIPRSDTAKIVIFLDNKQIANLTQGIDLTGGGWLSVLDSAGRPLIRLDDSPVQNDRINLPEHYFSPGKGYFEHVVDDSKMFVTYTTSSYNDWVYTAAVPQSQIMEKVTNIKYITSLLTFIYLAIGTTASLLFAYRNTRPIRKLIISVRGKIHDGLQTGYNEYETIQSAISQIITNNKLLENIVENQKPLLRSTFIKRLVDGDFINLDELDAFMTNSGIELPDGKFIVVMLYVKGYGDMVDESILTELNRVRAIISNIKLDHQVLTYDLSERSIVNIFRYDPDTPDDAVKAHAELTVRSLHERLLNQFHIQTYFAFGDICTTLLDISNSYYKANITLDALLSSGDCPDLKSGDGRMNDAFQYYEGMSELSTLFYPLRIERRIRNLIESGEVLELKKILQFIYYENFTRRSLNRSNLDVFLHELYGTYDKIRSSRSSVAFANQASGPDIDFKNTENGSVLFMQIQDRMVLLSKWFNDLKTAQNNDLGIRIIDYINQQYTQPNLSLQSMADSFGLNDIYMSRFFKKHVGENFSVYLERIRIEKATEILEQQNQTVDAISGQVGYNSAMSFRRAFKKVMGINPSDYRKNTG